MLLVSALEPSPAQAWLLGLPSPGQVISGLLGGLGHVIGGTVGKLAVTAFDAIIHALFAPIAHFINTQLIGWLVAVPDYAPPGSHVAATERTVLAMAGAALGAVATISIARFWAAGLAGSGASALEGLARTVGAALFLPVWPWVFHTAVALANEASTGLLGSGSVTKSSANLLAVGVGAGVGLGFLGVGLFVAIVMAVVASVLFLGLLMMKVVLAISTVLVFIGMPIAIVLSPVISWIPRVLARAFLVCLAVPLVWAMCFAASGALLNDGLFLKGSSGFFDALLEPLAAIALLWLMLLLPTRLAQMAMLGAGAVSGGFVSRAVSYAAGSQLRDVARQHLPGWAGGHGGAGDAALEGRPTRGSGARLRAESVLAASKAAGAAAARPAARRGGAAAGAASASGKHGGSNGASNGSAERQAGWLGRVRGAANPRAYSPPPLAGSEGAVAASGGLQRPSWRQEDFDAEMLEASLREQHQPVSAEQARQARDALPGRDAGRGGQPGRRPRAAGAPAPGLPGAGRVDAAGARGDPHARRGEPRGQGAGVRRSRRVDGRVRREQPSRPPPDAPAPQRRAAPPAPAGTATRRAGRRRAAATAATRQPRAAGPAAAGTGDGA